MILESLVNFLDCLRRPILVAASERVNVDKTALLFSVAVGKENISSKEKWIYLSNKHDLIIWHVNPNLPL